MTKMNRHAMLSSARASTVMKEFRGAAALMLRMVFILVCLAGRAADAAQDHNNDSGTDGKKNITRPGVQEHMQYDGGGGICRL